ncbi:MAG: hypothetical protein RL495_333 [Verrucomicrobiota bacterium]
MTGTGVGDSGISISAISRGNLEPAAEARMADSRKADALVAVTCHLNESWLLLHFQPPTANRQHLTFAPLHRPEADLHFCTLLSSDDLYHILRE